MIYTTIHLIKNLRLSNLNSIYDHYYLCFKDGYEFIQQPLNELQLIGHFDVKCYNYNNYKTVFDKLNELNEIKNDFIKSCKLQNNENNIILTCKKIHPYSENEDGLKFLVKIIKSLIGHDVDFINNENEQS